MDNKKIEEIVDNLFLILPLFKKKLLKPAMINNEINLSPSHMQILFFLNEMGDKVPISEVGKNLKICKPNMTPLIKDLLNQNLIEKFRGVKDKRYFNISITQKGKELLDKHKLSVAKALKEKLSELNERDLIKLANSLNNLTEVLSNLD